MQKPQVVEEPQSEEVNRLNHGQQRDAQEETQKSADIWQKGDSVVAGKALEAGVLVAAEVNRNVTSKSDRTIDVCVLW